ncbi:MAG: hotdog domain-containing protein [Oscillospiraceae bacterium]|nr:hotdog domain-containing protein [Oscillospiraceae bacterium]
MIAAGVKNKKYLTVGDADTALRIGSGSLPVLATPRVAALMEAAACESVEALLEPGATSVGTRLELAHLSADPVGATVVCESELTEVDGRRLVFRLVLRDGAGVAAEATHERFIVQRDRFLQKAAEKLSAQKVES